MDMATQKRSKKLPQPNFTHLSNLLREICDREFDGNGTKFAAAVGISQSHMSQILRGVKSDRGPGISTLIAVSDYLKQRGRPHTFEAMLGLEPAVAAQAQRAGEERASLEREKAAIDEERQEMRKLRESIDAVIKQLGPTPTPVPPKRRRTS